MTNATITPGDKPCPTLLKEKLEVDSVAATGQAVNEVADAFGNVITEAHRDQRAEDEAQQNAESDAYPEVLPLVRRRH